MRVVEWYVVVVLMLGLVIVMVAVAVRLACIEKRGAGMSESRVVALMVAM